MTSRRQLLTALGAAVLAAPLPARGQGAPYHVAFLDSESPTDASEAARLEAFRDSLRSLGYVEGKSIVLEVRWAQGNYDQLPALVAELVRQKVDVIVVSGTKALVAASKGTSTIPIVMGSSGDPVRLGVTTNFAHPSANVTGWTTFGAEVYSKLVELLKEAAPRTAHAAYLNNPADRSYALEPIQRTAASLKVAISPFEARSPGELERAFVEIAKARCDALIVQADTMFSVNVRKVARLALDNRLPSASTLYDFAEAGGLITYGTDRSEGYRRAAVFVDRIRKGAKPGDLPIEQASRFDLIVNVATSRALNLSLPESLLSRARLI